MKRVLKLSMTVTSSKALLTLVSSATSLPELLAVSILNVALPLTSLRADR